ncbi:MAG: hypothetical protein WC729_30005 [Sphingomonas sp.]|jgi:hypothetical protein|uniref:hypothetical protein n=1 Tax=Sphingomonas sp. TaxID=28214 RepID=UPI0035646AF2
MGLLASRVSRVGTSDGVVSPASGAAAPGASASGEEQVALNIFPWWLYGPEGSEFFYVDTGVQTIPVGGVATLLANSALTVGKGRVGVIVTLALLVQTPAATDDFFYTMLRNSGPETGLDRLRNFPVASAFSLRELSGYVIRLKPQDAITWTVTNSGPAARDVSVSYIGWTVPESEVRRIQRGVNY